MNESTWAGGELVWLADVRQIELDRAASRTLCPTIVCIVFQTDANGGRTMMGDAASLRTCNRRRKDATMEVNPHPIIRKKAYQDLGQTQLWEGNS